MHPLKQRFLDRIASDTNHNVNDRAKVEFGGSFRATLKRQIGQVPAGSEVFFRHDQTGTFHYFPDDFTDIEITRYLPEDIDLTEARAVARKYALAGISDEDLRAELKSRGPVLRTVVFVSLPTNPDDDTIRTISDMLNDGYIIDERIPMPDGVLLTLRRVTNDDNPNNVQEASPLSVNAGGAPSPDEIDRNLEALRPRPNDQLVQYEVWLDDRFERYVLPKRIIDHVVQCELRKFNLNSRNAATISSEVYASNRNGDVCKVDVHDGDTFQAFSMPDGDRFSLPTRVVDFVVSCAKGEPR